MYTGRSDFIHIRYNDLNLKSLYVTFYKRFIFNLLLNYKKSKVNSGLIRMNLPIRYKI